MSLQPLFILAIVCMVALAVMRVVRVHLGRAPHPEGIAKLLFILAFLVVPPIALGSLILPGEATGQFGGLGWVPLYTVIVTGLTVLMWMASVAIRLVAPRGSGQLLLLALVASEVDPEAVRFDPPVTAKLAESVAVVDKTNAVFPRGLEFPAQIDRVGFRVDWDALNAATGTLEGRIADDHRVGLAVASRVKATAVDARSRLDTLRGLASAHGQVWAS